MKSLLLSCVAFTLALMPAVAVPDTRAPLAIQYDEISRMVPPGGTPPAPDGFAAELAKAHDGAITDTMGMPSMSQMMTPQLGLGSIFGALMNPAAALLGIGSQMLMGAVMGGMMQGAMGGAKGFQTGRLTHVAFYQNNVRYENIAEKKVNIVDFNAKQRTEVDLATQRYKVMPLDAWAQMPPDVQMPADKQDGTATIDITTQTTQTAGQTIGGVATTGYDTVITLTISNVTGNCHPMSMRLETLKYVANDLPEPSMVAPSFDRLITTHPENLAMGCKATESTHSTGPAVPDDRFVVFSRTQMTPNEAPGDAKVQPVYFVSERGNIRPVTAEEAPKLFSVPAGFARQE